MGKESSDKGKTEDGKSLKDNVLKDSDTKGKIEDDKKKKEEQR